MLYCSIMMDAAKATTMARASQARKLMLNELLTSVLNEIRAVIDTDTFDPARCNTALASLNEFLFQEFLGEQCAFQCVQGLSTPSGITFFSPAGRRYSGTHELMRAVSLAAEIARLTAARDCGQPDVCATPPGCARHWEERCRELAAELAEAQAAVFERSAAETDKRVADARADGAREEREACIDMLTAVAGSDRTSGNDASALKWAIKLIGDRGDPVSNVLTMTLRMLKSAEEATLRAEVSGRGFGPIATTALRERLASIGAAKDAHGFWRLPDPSARGGR